VGAEVAAAAQRPDAGTAGGAGPDRARPQPLVSVRGVTKRFGSKRVLSDVDLTVHAGEAVALVGENGCGKTTLLRICAGLTRPDAGSVSLHGRLGYCPQQPGLFDLLNADEHLAFFGAAAGMRRGEAISAGRQILAEMDFPVGDRGVARSLSGGTRQKLNLALSLLGDPQVLLLDEPYQGFDRGSYVNFWDHVDRWRERGCATLVVTHMLAELSRVDRVVDLAAARDHRGGEGARS
jgi:ABC-2 type transport system ATP-binding protein